MFKIILLRNAGSSSTSSSLICRGYPKMTFLVLTVSVDNILQYMYALTFINTVPVSHIWVCHLFSCYCQKVADQTLTFVRILDEYLDGRCQYLQLNCSLLISKGVYPAVECLDGTLVNLLGILAQNPCCSLLGLSFCGIWQQLD